MARSHAHRAPGVAGLGVVWIAIAGGVVWGTCLSGVLAQGGSGPRDRMTVDDAAADRGRQVWAAECVTCHGANARGGSAEVNILRSELVISNRNGDLLGPFLKKGHPTQSGHPSSGLTAAQTLDLSHFLRQRFNDTLRGSPVFVAGNVLVGNAAAGKAFFEGNGRCTECHSTTGDFAGIGRKYDPVNLQQRLVFPMAGAGGRGRGGPPPPPTSTVTISGPGRETVGGTLLELDEFIVSYRDANGLVRSVRRAPGVVVEVKNRFKRHIEMLDTLTDDQMHDLVAYLETLK